MKKIFNIVIFILVLSIFAPVQAQQMRANAKTHRIPRGQKMEIRMVDPITSQEIQKGDIFTASLTKDIEIDGEIILPAGSLVRGTIGSVTPSKRLSKSAIIYLNFDHIVDPTGQQLPIKAGVCSNFVILDDGSIAGGGNYGAALKQNWEKTKQITINSTNWGIVKGEQLFNGGRFLVTPFSAVGGAIGGGFYYVGDGIADLFRKGNDIVINQGDIFTILLLDNIDIPIW